MSRDELFTIGEFSAITGVGIYSLRYYDEIGALKPEFVDPVSNYRYYGFKQLSRIPAISICKDAGIKLSDLDSYLENGSVDYSRLLAESRRSIEKIIDDCRQKERGFDRIEELCSISSGLSSVREVTADVRSLDIWAAPYEETVPDAGSSGMLVALSESAGSYRVRIMPSVYGILRVITEGGTIDYAFSMLADPDETLSCDGHHMSIPGGKYLFSSMDSCSIDGACDIISSLDKGCGTDQLMSLALISGSSSGPVYCAAARLSD